MKMKTLLASIAVASFVMAQPLAAATRSADSVPQRGLQAIDARVASPVTNANYQDDDDDGDGGSTAVILGVILIVLIGVAAISGGGGDSNN
jgi:hypothetical protein